MTCSDLANKILRLPRTVKRLIAVSLDAVLCIVAVWIAISMRHEIWVPFTEIPILPVLVSVTLIILIFGSFGIYQEIFRYSSGGFIFQHIYPFTIYGLIYLLLFTVIGFPGVPRTIGLMQPFSLLVLLTMSRFLVGRLFNQNQKMDMFSERPGVLIYGAGTAGRQLADSLDKSREKQHLGFLDDDARLWGNSISGKRIYSTSDLSEIIAAIKPAEIWLALPSVSASRKNEILENLRGFPTRVLTLPSLVDLTTQKIQFKDVRELNADELLGRDPIKPILRLMKYDIRDKVVLITGAGGSIGRELCKCVLRYGPRKLLLIDHSEYALYSIHKDLLNEFENTSETTLEDENNVVPLLGTLLDKDFVQRIFDAWRPDTVYHAAAYKHVPLIEYNSAQAVTNNVWGTLNCAEAALRFSVAKFVLISTDKAVRPTSLMGASKRLAELILQALNAEHETNLKSTNFAIVRFGNVLNSSGSVLPLFRHQITNGGPITVTHPEVTRFFMSIPEAAQLVVQAGAMSEGGELFILDMGGPIKIVDLAVRLIELSGLKLKSDTSRSGDIEIKYTGLRPGEKLYEELSIENRFGKTAHPRIMKSVEPLVSWGILKEELAALKVTLEQNNVPFMKSIIERLVEQYTPPEMIVDSVYVQENL